MPARFRTLSPEGTRELLDEMSRPPEDTPERRRIFALSDIWLDAMRRDTGNRGGNYLG